jgi:hypothetical protein
MAAVSMSKQEVGRLEALLRARVPSLTQVNDGSRWHG